MGWLISRQEVNSDPGLARQKAMAMLANLEEVDRPEELLMSILIDAILMVEAYRGARHQIALLPELQGSVDALLRELSIVERTKEWAREPHVAAEAG
jgi:hypothetical protein